MAIIRMQSEQDAAQGIYYEVDTASEPLGGGGMGTVFPGYRIDSTGLRREAAIKFLFDDLPSTVIDRARQEASIQIKNDNLLEMFGFIQIKQTDMAGNSVSRYHVASELLHGVMLFDLLRGVTTDKQGKEISYAQELVSMMNKDRVRFALSIVKNVLSGIMALHDAGFAHRDIDPSNIMITSDGKIKVIDYGIVKKLNDAGPQLSIVGQFLGKPSYAAPEIVKGWVHDQNKTTDIYSIGIMLFELVTGHLPFLGSSDEVIEKQKTSPLPVDEIASKELIYVLNKATAKKQSDRYQSAAEFRVDVEHLLSGTPISHSLMPKGNAKSGSGIPQWLIWSILCIIGLLIGGICAFLL